MCDRVVDSEPCPWATASRRRWQERSCHCRGERCCCALVHADRPEGWFDALERAEGDVHLQLAQLMRVVLLPDQRVVGECNRASRVHGSGLT